MKSTQELKQDHITIRRIKTIAKKCSELLYEKNLVPTADLEIISVVIEEFIDHFHHGKEETAYFPHTKSKDDLDEDVRKFLIEHELGRRIASMLRRSINELKVKLKENNDNSSEIFKFIEPVARFLKSYSIFIDDHTQKEDKFFEFIENMGLISKYEDNKLQEHYMTCKKNVGGELRINQMMKLIEYLEEREWMQK